MKRLFICTVALLLIGNTIDAQDKKTKPAQKTNSASMPDSATMMKAWQAYMTPGKFHQMMAKDDGSWNEEITMWMDPSAPPSKSTATAENKMIMGGRYQESVHKGNFDGMPFEGRSILGYDNARKMYVSSWIDNMGTGIMYMEGKWDDKLKGIVFKGKSVDPMTGKEMMVREVFRIIDDNTQVLEMYDNKMGKEMKTMEIKFTRNKQ
jgi:hypothetical protein